VEGKRNRVSKRAQKEYSLRRAGPACVWTARFSVGGRSIERSTGERDEGAAHQEAARILAHERARAGSGGKRRRRSTSVHTLEELVTAWLLWLEPTHAASTRKTWEDYATSHFIPHFQVVENLITEECSTYVRKRLMKVRADTVRKEASALRSLLEFCGLPDGAGIAKAEVPSIPKRATGKRHPVRRRQSAPELAPDEVIALISRLPEWSTSRKVKRFPIRARFEVAYGTGLRPSTIDKLSVPEHYSKGAKTLVLTDEIDKARWGRELPLSPEVREALDRVCPKEGVIFGWHDYRDHLRKAAKETLPPEVAKRFAGAHLRSAKTTHLLEQGAALPGVQYLVGHKLISTTARYVKPSFRAAQAAVDLGIPKQPTESKQTA
jgi:site-specific recombinase XerD